MANDNVKAIAESVWIQSLARLAMIGTMPVAGFLVWIGSQWLAAQFAAINTKIETAVAPLTKIEERVDDLEDVGRTKDLVDQKQDFMIDSNNKAVTQIVATVEKVVGSVQDLKVAIEKQRSTIP